MIIGKIFGLIYHRIKEILENHGSIKLMAEVEDDELLSGEDARAYYRSLKNSIVEK
ncbi:hypothetical protein V0288_11850 [Pannus brasiliensis CCIBt3594]|uniref:Uncharacterized protein n=1 Tax=Pannus brasiliensis CCIBt3594 TaxID=1427578 RepID=A0AAW9QUR0_9CHRO